MDAGALLLEPVTIITPAGTGNSPDVVTRATSVVDDATPICGNVVAQRAGVGARAIWPQSHPGKA
jgi:tripartite-type tricarboxylate transporter receptor subunit TctC